MAARARPEVPHAHPLVLKSYSLECSTRGAVKSTAKATGVGRWLTVAWGRGDPILEVRARAARRTTSPKSPPAGDEAAPDDAKRPTLLRAGLFIQQLVWMLPDAP